MFVQIFFVIHLFVGLHSNFLRGLELGLDEVRFRQVLVKRVNEVGIRGRANLCFFLRKNLFIFLFAKHFVKVVFMCLES